MAIGCIRCVSIANWIMVSEWDSINGHMLLGAEVTAHIESTGDDLHKKYVWIVVTDITQAAGSIVRRLPHKTDKSPCIASLRTILLYVVTCQLRK